MATSNQSQIKVISVVNNTTEMTIYCLALIFQESEKTLFSTASDLQKKKGFSKVPDQLLQKLKSQFFRFSQLCGLTSSSPAKGSSKPGGKPTQRMTPQRGGFSFTSTREPTSSPGCPRGGVEGLGEGGAAGDVGSGCSPITDWTERERGPWLMLSMGPVFRFRLKGREWNLLSLDIEAGGGALEGGEDWLKSGGVSVSDLAGSSPTEAEKTEIKVNINSTLYNVEM